MKKSLLLLMLFVMGLMLCVGQVLADDGGDAPDEDAPELYAAGAVAVFEFDVVNLTEDDSSGDEPEEEIAE